MTSDIQESHNRYIQIENVSKRFGANTVLDGVDLTIKKGESIVIIGQSGTGKSVLLKNLIRLMSPDSGRILFDGVDIETLKGPDLVAYRQRFGMLFQSSALFDSMSVERNVGLGLRESGKHSEAAIKLIVHEKLEMVGLADTGTKFPSELSGGMCKRIGLARAIASEPEVLLYDEPTTGLDPITAEVINDMIVDVNTKLKVTSIAVTHDMKSALKIADRIVFLYQGKIEFDGSPQEVRNTDNPALKQFVYGRSDGPIQVR
ncbi:MAG: ABC transporter ATP-binding protein [candidate division Zixibacteria bacterium]|nr:ABC transporter ATP-binding protein [candidate division Zixibacteria bacterium]